MITEKVYNMVIISITGTYLSYYRFLVHDKKFQKLESFVEDKKFEDLGKIFYTLKYIVGTWVIRLVNIKFLKVVFKFLVILSSELFLL